MTNDEFLICANDTRYTKITSKEYLNAARYSASPIGGFRPPDHATFTL